MGIAQSRKTHCAKGHEYNEANILWRIRKNGKTWRVCRECRRIESRDIGKQFRKRRNRRIRNGVLHNKGLTGRTLMERFIEFVGGPETNGCILWQGAIDGAGYGQFLNANGSGKGTTAHRFLYESVYGPQPGLVIDHKCENKLCVNIEHLQAVTSGENVRLHYIRIKEKNNG